jgi:ABC-type branched-subunit amino acid transport system substrate-binding protein
VADDVRLITDLWQARLDGAPESLRVAFVVPVSGALGLVGPVAINCGLLGAAEVNAAGGVLGRPIELVLVDGGRAPSAVADDVTALVRDAAVQAVVGLHASDVREAVVPAVHGAVPYVYTPPYEGGERTPGLFLLGEVPRRQLRPALAWLGAHRRAHRWFLLGNDYVWPRRLHDAARGFLRSLGATVVGERLVPLGTCDPEPLLAEMARSRADAVLLTLIGTDLVVFNRAFAAGRWAQRVPRLCAALEENGLLGAGGDSTGELYAAMGYFGSLTSDAGLDFAERYARRYGPHAPVLSGHGEACYDGIRMLAGLITRAGTPATAAVDACADGTSIVGGRGPLTMRSRHVDQAVHLARADGLDFAVIATF